jgi:hypothetical protein
LRSGAGPLLSVFVWASAATVVAAIKSDLEEEKGLDGDGW